MGLGIGIVGLAENFNAQPFGHRMLFASRSITHVVGDAQASRVELKDERAIDRDEWNSQFGRVEDEPIDIEVDIGSDASRVEAEERLVDIDRAEGAEI